MVHQLQADTAVHANQRIVWHAPTHGKVPKLSRDIPPPDNQHCRAAQEAVVWCSTCGSNVHEQCFGKWVEQRRKAGAHPACVFCRSAWAVNKPPPHAEKTREGRARKPSTVVNLLDVSQVRPRPGVGSGVTRLNRLEC